MMITVRAAAYKLDVSEMHAYYLIHIGEISGTKIRWIWRLWDKEVDSYALRSAEGRAGEKPVFDPQYFGYLFDTSSFPGHDLQGNNRSKPSCIHGGRGMVCSEKRLARLPGKELNFLDQFALFSTLEPAEKGFLTA